MKYVGLVRYRGYKGLRSVAQFLRWFPRTVSDWAVRGYRGYADCDVWSVDSYLSGLLPRMLNQLREQTHGYPCSMDLLLTEEMGANDEVGMNLWVAILTAIIDGFEAHTTLNETVPWYDDSPDLTFPFKAGDEFSLWLEENNDSIKEQMETERVKIARGMELFVEYYDALWD
jgi:hypothetical protein